MNDHSVIIECDDFHRDEFFESFLDDRERTACRVAFRAPAVAHGTGIVEEDIHAVVPLLFFLLLHEHVTAASLQLPEGIYVKTARLSSGHSLNVPLLVETLDLLTEHIGFRLYVRREHVAYLVRAFKLTKIGVSVPLVKIVRGCPGLCLVRAVKRLRRLRLPRGCGRVGKGL